MDLKSASQITKCQRAKFIWLRFLINAVRGNTDNFAVIIDESRLLQF